MNFFSIRTNDQNTIGEILKKTKQIVFDTLSWHQDEVLIGDIIFIVISGDSSKKLHKYENGLRAIGRVIELPKGESDTKHFTLDVEIFEFLSRTITKDDFYIYPSLKDAPNIGPDTKSAPNQAFRKIDSLIGKSIIRAVADILKQEFSKTLFNSIVDNDFRIAKLELLPESIAISHSSNDTTFLQNKFIEWMNNEKNYRKSYDGLVSIPILNFWNSTYFKNALFKLDINNLNASLLHITDIIGEKANNEWRSYSQATSNGAPEAILGKNNYLKFLGEFINDENNVHEIREMVDKRVGKSNLTPIDVFYRTFYNKLEEARITFSPQLIKRFVASLCTKPFVILTGLSGSGKTKLAQAFAMWICEKNNQNNKQYCIVPVGADWTNREPLLGFPNALIEKDYKKDEYGVLQLIIDANANSDKPYFLILDEMNLSHVERYFADFLSVMESKSNISLHSGNEDWNEVPSEIGFPKNLFIIGTVNIDETTYMFSPKVLDRANVIEFRVTKEEMENYLKNNSIIDLKKIEGLGATMAGSFVEIAKDDGLKANDTEELNNSLISFFSELKKTGAEFGYRSASEILRFAAVVNKIEPTWSMAEIIDAAIMQKLLPKVHGSRRKLEPVLKTLGQLCLQNGQTFDDLLNAKTEIDYKDVSKIKYPVSLEKILRMFDNLTSNGFTSYAEA